MIINGKQIISTLPVYDFVAYPDIEIKPWLGARRRLQKIDMIVLHWTAGEGSVQQVHSVLQRRKLGVEFIIDGHGTIWQCCDPCMTDAKDCGKKFDPRSIGVEIVNYGIVWPPWRKVPTRGSDRPVMDQRIHGVRVKRVASFYVCQRISVLGLVDSLLKAFPDIDRTVPLDKNGKLITRKLNNLEAKAFSGVVGHYHLSRRKIDPGTELMEEVGRFLEVI